MPQEIKRFFDAAERTAYSHLSAGRYEEAERVYSSQLAILKDLQRRVRKRVHKGGPFHNRGISLLLQQKITEGRWDILRALVEDVLSATAPAEWRGAPAYRTLSELGMVHPAVLARIEDQALTFRDSGRSPWEPEAVLGRVEVPPLQPDVQLRIQAPQAVPLPVPSPKPADLVFVGGSFKTIALLRHFRDLVAKRGHFPILLDYELPPWLDAYEVSVAALDDCACAIFDISIPEGQIAEIIHHFEKWKRTGAANPRILLLMQELFGRKSPRVPAMIPPDYKARTKRYRILSMAEKHIDAFLP